MSPDKTFRIDYQLCFYCRFPKIYIHHHYSPPSDCLRPLVLVHQLAFLHVLDAVRVTDEAVQFAAATCLKKQVCGWVGGWVGGCVDEGRSKLWKANRCNMRMHVE